MANKSRYTRQITHHNSKIGAVTVAALAAYADPGSPNRCGHDPGPMVLAALATAAGVAPTELALRAVGRWLAELPDQVRAVGAFGGLGGFLAGVRAAGSVCPRLSGLAGSLLARTPGWLAGVGWRTSRVAWRDYDLFNGPAGLVLAGITRDTSGAPFVRALRHLSTLCDQPGLARLRAGTEIDPRSAFNLGRINTGLGHGVAGVAAALRHAVVSCPDGAGYRPALARACGWLAREAFIDARGLITWPPAGREGAGGPGEVYQRQAWCYGAPGVAWTLWDAGVALADPDLRELAEEAMRLFCRRFDPDRYLDPADGDGTLAVCHGAAGTLAVVDAFIRHAGLAEAGPLRAELRSYLAERTSQVTALAERDVTMLNGAGGILSVLLTVHGGERGWLPLLALR